MYSLPVFKFKNSKFAILTSLVLDLEVGRREVDVNIVLENLLEEPLPLPELQLLRVVQLQDPLSMLRLS